MKTIQLNNKKYEMPTSWDDITVEDQIRISEIAEKYTGLTSQLQLIAGYAKIPVEEIKHAHVSKLPTLVGHLEFLNKEIDTTPIESFEHRGHTYHLGQTLLNGEFQDFISLEAVIKNNEGKVYKGLPMMIAILAKREGETLDDYDLEERSKEFYDLPITIANKISGFFLSIGITSQLSSQTYLEQLEKETEQEVIKRLDELENITKQLDGQGLLGLLQKKILRKYVKFLKKNYLSYLTGTPSKS